MTFAPAVVPVVSLTPPHGFVVIGTPSGSVAPASVTVLFQHADGSIDQAVSSCKLIRIEDEGTSVRVPFDHPVSARLTPSVRAYSICARASARSETSTPVDLPSTSHRTAQRLRTGACERDPSLVERITPPTPGGTGSLQQCVARRGSLLRVSDPPIPKL